MTWWSWQQGRQDTGYWKFKILDLGFLDLYLLTYSSGQYLPDHVDLIQGKRHLRCNLILRHAKLGGKFDAEHILFQNKNLKIFYSDRKHRMSKIIKGKRIVLSLGLCL